MRRPAPTKPFAGLGRGRSTNDRIVGILVVGLALLGVLWLRCVWLQVVWADRLSTLAKRQYTVTQTLLAQRGRIYDRQGRPMALSVLVPSVFANPRQVDDPRDTARRLAELLDRDVTTVRRRLETDRGFIWIARQVDPDLTTTIRRFQGEGVDILEEPKRFYPHGPLASHLLGFVDIDQVGLEGVELALNGVLQGQPGLRATLKDARGQWLIGSWTSETNPIHGSDVVLTIDSVVQEVVEETLDWGLARYRAKGGSIIAMDPQTGAILAMANRPSFDPNAPGRTSADQRRNRALTDLLEPGSVFKVVAAAALLEEGLVQLDEPFDCEQGAFRTVGRHILHDHRPHGALPFRDVIRYSSNIGMAKAAQRLKPEVFYRYIRAFGFGSKSGIDVPGEVSGIIAPPSRWSKLSPFIIPIGQEVAVTPLQLAVMMATIANGGERVQPYVVERVQTAEGTLIRSHVPPASQPVISPETARVLQSLLVSVVESGTGRPANVQGLTVAGKTGTAQKLEPNGRYSHSRYVASFVGFGPVPDARFVLVVCVDEPQPVHFGSQVAAPMFQRIVERLVSYWDLGRHVVNI